MDLITNTFFDNIGRGRCQSTFNVRHSHQTNKQSTPWPDHTNKATSDMLQNQNSIQTSRNSSQTLQIAKVIDLEK